LVTSVLLNSDNVPLNIINTDVPQLVCVTILNDSYHNIDFRSIIGATKERMSISCTKFAGFFRSEVSIRRFERVATSNVTEEVHFVASMVDMTKFNKEKFNKRNGHTVLYLCSISDSPKTLKSALNIISKKEPHNIIVVVVDYDKTINGTKKLLKKLKTCVAEYTDDNCVLIAQYFSPKKNRNNNQVAAYEKVIRKTILYKTIKEQVFEAALLSNNLIVHNIESNYQTTLTQLRNQFVSKKLPQRVIDAFEERLKQLNVDLYLKKDDATELLTNFKNDCDKQSSLNIYNKLA
jgi:hypothetical protein